jgi:hypothetical protein
MKSTDNQINKLFSLINFSEADIVPSKGFKEQLLSDLMKRPEMSLNLVYRTEYTIIEKLIKFSLPLSILLTLFIKIEVI